MESKSTNSSSPISTVTSPSTLGVTTEKIVVTGIPLGQDGFVKFLRSNGITVIKVTAGPGENTVTVHVPDEHMPKARRLIERL